MNHHEFQYNQKRYNKCMQTLIQESKQEQLSVTKHKMTARWTISEANSEAFTNQLWKLCKCYSSNNFLDN